MNPTMIATVLGSGTSTGVPPIGCTDPVCLSRDPKNTRLRAGLLVREGPGVPSHRARAFVVDCGPDFREQALRHRIDRLDGMLLTHTHYDHVGGMDDLRLYNFRQGHDLPVYGPKHALDDLRERYHYFFNPPQIGGGVASLDLRPVGTDEPFEFLGQRIVPLPVKHGLLDVMGFRLGDFAFVTDASEIDRETAERIRGCRTLVLNALRHRPHSTHLSLVDAVEFARSVGANRTLLVHMTHHLEHHGTNAVLPDGIELAWDGCTFPFAPDCV